MYQEQQIVAHVQMTQVIFFFNIFSNVLKNISCMGILVRPGWSSDQDPYPGQKCLQGYTFIIVFLDQRYNTVIITQI